MTFLKSKDSLFTALVVLVCLFSMYGNSESKPTLGPTMAVQSNHQDTKESEDDLMDSNEDTDGLMDQPLESLEADEVLQSSEGERLKRETATQTPMLPNPCVMGYKLKLIDRQKIIPIAICAQGCRAKTRVIYLPDREDPFVFVADCRK